MPVRWTRKRHETHDHHVSIELKRITLFTKYIIVKNRVAGRYSGLSEDALFVFTKHIDFNSLRTFFSPLELHHFVAMCRHLKSV